jgi:HlyD family secretion protein
MKTSSFFEPISRSIPTLPSLEAIVRVRNVPNRSISVRNTPMRMPAIQAIALLLSASLAFITLSACGAKPEAQAAANSGEKAGEKPVAGTNTTSAAIAAVTKVVALGRVEPEGKIAALSLETAGVVRDIYVREGQHVESGAQLLELSHDVESARLAFAQTKSGTQGSEVEVIKASLQSAQLRAQNQKEKFERLQKIFDSGAETRQNLDNAKTDFETAQRETERLQASLQSAQSRVREFAADARVAQAEIARKTLRAPSDGTILSVNPVRGGSVESGKSVMDFAPDGAVTVLCEVDELFVNKLQLGQTATIRSQGGSEALAQGTVMSIAPYLKKKSIFSDEAAALEDRRIREVRVKLSNAGTLLLGSRVECVIAVK